MNIEITAEQRQALQAQHGKPLDVLDPATSKHYVLVTREQYERVCSLLDRAALDKQTDAHCVPPGILRSQQEFWRNLPELLKNKRNHGKTVCYHQEERIGIADRDEPLIRECLRRGLPRREYDLFTIQPLDVPPWEPEEVESLGPWNFKDDSHKNENP